MGRGARWAGRVSLRVAGVWSMFLVVPTVLAVGTGVLAIWTDQVGAFVVFGGLLTQIAGGAAGSFVLHESSHAFVLGMCDGVERVDVTSSLLRISLQPLGAFTTRQAVLVALAGPGSCVLVGAVLLALLPGSQLQWWYLTHAVFLLPPFGDGRALLHSVRFWLVPRG